MKSPFKRLRNLFLQGFIGTAPVFLSLYLLWFLFRLVYRTGNAALVFLPLEYRDAFFTANVVKTLAVVVMLLGIAFVGYLSKTIFGRAVQSMIEKALYHIPGFRGVYTAIRRMVDVFVTKREGNFSSVVLVEYPHKGKWVIAFHTGEPQDKLKPQKDRDFATVFMPSTPNPTTGYLMIVPKDDIIHTSLSTEEAFRFVLSGGTL